ncbi:MAG: DUF4093 domain-containing protein [Clostridia bacterium]|nr:DUF4093 domain-containing protein [Clostridia bacterium]
MKLRLSLPVIVEGRYDRIKLDSLLDTLIITTEGFGLFNDPEKREYIKKVCRDGVIVATDSDGAGNMIRAHLRGLLPPESIINVYIPQVKGKEKRKSAPSAEGFLGVEGTDAKTLYELFLPYAGGQIKRCTLDRGRLYSLGLSGGENSAEKRAQLCRIAGLPQNITAKALWQAIETTYDAQGAEELLKRFAEGCE